MTCRRSSTGKQSPIAAFFLAALPAQKGDAGINSARVLLQCIDRLSPVLPLLEASCALLGSILESNMAVWPYFHV